MCFETRENIEWKWLLWYVLYMFNNPKWQQSMIHFSPPKKIYSTTIHTRSSFSIPFICHSTCVLSILFVFLFFVVFPSFRFGFVRLRSFLHIFITFFPLCALKLYCAVNVLKLKLCVGQIENVHVWVRQWIVCIHTIFNRVQYSFVSFVFHVSPPLVSICWKKGTYIFLFGE